MPLDLILAGAFAVLGQWLFGPFEARTPKIKLVLRRAFYRLRGWVTEPSAPTVEEPLE